MRIGLGKIGAAAAVALAATPAQAQGGRGRPLIPAQFHGTWAPSVAACRSPATQNVVTINARGTSGWEEIANVVRAGQVRGGTYYFRVNNQLQDRDVPGSIALRRDGARLVMTTIAERTITATMVRCPSGWR